MKSNIKKSILITFFLLFYSFTDYGQEIYGKYMLSTVGTIKYLTLRKDFSYLYNITADVCDKTYHGKYAIRGDTIILDSAVGASLPIKYLFEDGMFLKEANKKFEYKDSVLISYSFYEFKKIESYYDNGSIKQTMNWLDANSPATTDKRKRNGEWIFYNDYGKYSKKEYYKNGNLTETWIYLANSNYLLVRKFNKNGHLKKEILYNNKQPTR